MREGGLSVDPAGSILDLGAPFGRGQGDGTIRFPSNGRNPLEWEEVTEIFSDGGDPTVKRGRLGNALEMDSHCQGKVEEGSVAVIGSRQDRHLELGKDHGERVPDAGIVVGRGR